MRAPRRVQHILALGLSFDPTASHLLDVQDWDPFQGELLHTSSGHAIGASVGEDSQGPGGAILELHRLTGLTWEQLARLFQVARRSLHFWASGKPRNAANEEQLYRTLATIREIDRGSAIENRTLLFREQRGQIPFDLLASGRCAEVLALVGRGPGRAPRKLRPLSPEAQAARTPRPPEDLTGALQDRVHEERGRSESATPTRPKRDR